MSKQIEQKKKYKWLINTWRNFNIFSHKRNANQNNLEIPSQPSESGHCKENKQQQMLVRMWVNESSYTVGKNVNSATTVEINKEISQKTKLDYLMTLPCHSWVYIQRSISQYTKEAPAYLCLLHFCSQ
jgi:hypothetical protein